MDGELKGKRGCGSRKKGGVYWETNLSKGGLPVEYFLVDPVIEVQPEWGMSDRGMTFIEINKVWHLLDHVGEIFYPNVADFIEETRRMGASRRMPKSLDFSKLTPDSRLLLTHRRAGIVNCKQYPEWDCPKEILEHAKDKLPWGTTCLGVCWRDITDGEAIEKSDQVRRVMPSFTYDAFPRPKEITPVYFEGVFMALPPSRIVVVKDDDDRHLGTLEWASRAHLPVEEVEE